MGTAAVEARRATIRGRVTDLRWVRQLPHLVDSRLHSRRRRAAQLQLQSARPRSVLFMCHGNICRSPFAAALFTQLLPPSIKQRMNVMSAGFVGHNRPSPDAALSAGRRYGVDLSAHRSALVTSESLQAAGLVVVMSEEQARGIRARVQSRPVRVLVLGDLDPLPAARRTISDPWGGSDEAFESSYVRIERCVGELVKLLSPAA